MALMLLLGALALAIGGYLHATRPGKRSTSLPLPVGSWGAPANNDPRVATAAMMYLVATEDAAVTPGKMDQMVALLSATVGMTPEEALICLNSGKHLSRRLDGSLNSRLHQLRGAIERSCSQQEKEDVVAMLRTVAGKSAERVPSIREALGRIAGSLLHG